MSIHQRIVNLLKDRYREDPCILGSSLLCYDDNTIIRTIFINYRKTDNGDKGLRVTGEAQLLLSYYFDSYEYNFPSTYIEKPAHVIFLDRCATMPWFLCATSIVFFEKELAMRFKLAGDIESLIESYEDYQSHKV